MIQDDSMPMEMLTIKLVFISGIIGAITWTLAGYQGLSWTAMLSALSGILFASRLQSATTTAGTLFELNAIAATYRVWAAKPCFRLTLSI